MAQEIERRSAAKKDFVAPAKKMEMVVVNDAPALALDVANAQPLTINKVAHSQIAEYAGIPKAYYDRMVADDPKLLATNVNRWLHDEAKNDQKRMVRTLDGTARALLSDKYRPLENEDLAEAILPVLLDGNFLIASCDITETRLYIKAIDRRIEKDVPTGRKMGDGSHVFFDTVSPAITVSNSEVGFGALAIETGIYTKACTNLAMIGTSLRKYHTGARAAISDEVYALLTNETKRVTDAAVWGQVRDLVTSAFDELRFTALTKKLGDATQDRMGDDPVEVIERAGKRFGLVETERKGILARLIEGGDLTRYGLHAAITRHSQDVLEYDRATELERLGGQVIELPRNQWQEVLKAA
jgi:hypothetical protein